MHQQVHTFPGRGRLRMLTRQWAVLVAGTLLFATIGFAAYLVTVREQPTVRVLPGEFEQHDLLLVAWPADEAGADVRASHARMVADIISAVDDQIEVAILTTDEAKRVAADLALFPAGASQPRHRYFQAPSESIWVRDYGPLVAKSFRGGYELIDTVYPHPYLTMLDDVPKAVNGSLRLPVIDAPIAMENGNLISNGAGLCVTTEKLVFENGESHAHVTKLLREFLGANQVLYLENLLGEPNGHVDMFLTFTAPDTVVVGQYSRAFDPENAAILDRNADRLAKVHTACGPLKVHRIPMPSRADGCWRTFTNVVYANGVLLVPTYGGYDRAAESQALALYRRLLPNWKIVDIDCSFLIQGNGSLHCITMNVYRANALDTLD